VLCVLWYLCSQICFASAVHIFLYAKLLIVLILIKLLLIIIILLLSFRVQKWIVLYVISVSLTIFSLQ